MERSAEEEKRGEETYYFYSPCYLVEQLIKALYKCLGKDTQQADADTTPASGAETQMKATEEEYAMESTMTMALGVTKGHRGHRAALEEVAKSTDRLLHLKLNHHAYV